MLVSKEVAYRGTHGYSRLQHLESQIGFRLLYRRAEVRALLHREPQKLPEGYAQMVHYTLK